MKCLLKALCFIGGILLILKAAQFIIDILYNSYGKKYIVSSEIN